MKEWNIEDLLAECEMLQRNPYTYDFERMPEGVCNGHTIRPCNFSLAAIIIDGAIINMGVINSRYPDGSVGFVVKGKEMNAKEFLRGELEGSF